jgi:hypothetical protein
VPLRRVTINGLPKEVDFPMGRLLRGVLLLAVTTGVLLVPGCADSRVPGPGPTSPQPTLIALEIQGNTEFTTIGASSQLRAEARWSDGRSTDVTAETSWSVAGSPNAFGTLATRTASVSRSGLLQATELGIGYVRAIYGLGRGERRVTVTPSGTFVVAGRVRHPGSSVLPDVAVREPISGQSTTTGSEGEFMLGALIGTELTLSKAQFETVTATVRPFDDLVDVPMQPAYRIIAGANVMGTIAPNDLRYEVRPGTICGVCRMVRVSSVAVGSLTVTLRWSGPASRMIIWAGLEEFQAPPGSTEVVARFPVSAGETVVYVGAASVTAHVAFDLTTGLGGS